MNKFGKCAHITYQFCKISYWDECEWVESHRVKLVSQGNWEPASCRAIVTVKRQLLLSATPSTSLPLSSSYFDQLFHVCQQAFARRISVQRRKFVAKLFPQLYEIMPKSENERHGAFDYLQISAYMIPHMCNELRVGPASVATRNGSEHAIVYCLALRLWQLQQQIWHGCNMRV